MVTRTGTAVSQGVAIAPAFVLKHNESRVEHEKTEDREGELERFRKARRKVLSELNELREQAGGEKEAILLVHTAMLEDPEFTASIERFIKEEGYNAAWAVDASTSSYVAILEDIGNDYFRERISDMRDVERRMLAALLGEAGTPMLSSPSVLVADYLLPSELIALEGHGLAGICLDGGGKTSHVAILARSAGIPAVISLGDFSRQVKPGQLVVVDGKYGEAVADPEREDLRKALKKQKRALKQEQMLLRKANLPAQTLDGRRISLNANVDSAEGIEGAIKAGAEGIGLFRTEFLAFRKDESEEVYIRAAQAAQGHKLVFRTYDIGGDKIPDELRIKEDNPVLGWRAVRFCMKNKELFQRQLVAILKASAVNPGVQLMFPMISGPDELSEVLSFFEETKENCRKAGIAFNEGMKVGSMIEVPSAALTAGLIAKQVDFLSLGTNDLTQYTLAVDRGNDRISYLYRPMHPAMLKLMKMVVDAARSERVPLSICGELAGELDYLPVLIGMGLDELSMSSHSILEARLRTRALRAEDCRSLFDTVSSLPNTTSVEMALKEFNSSNGKT